MKSFFARPYVFHSRLRLRLPAFSAVSERTRAVELPFCTWRAAVASGWVFVKILRLFVKLSAHLHYLCPAGWPVCPGNDKEQYGMKLISWNVNGLRACVEKGFRDAFAALDADVVCLQETKLQAGQLDLAFEGYEAFWNYAEKKGYSGTAVFTLRRPVAVSYGLGLPDHDREGRVVTLDFDTFRLVTVYTPNSQDGLRRLDYRMAWDDAFRAYVQRLDEEKPVVVCGDLNVAHQEIDLKNPKTNRRNAGFTDEERAKFGELLQAGFVDTFRHFYPTLEGAYSWWSYRFRAREKNAGWRIDYFLASQRLVPRMTGASIHSEIFGSDHCPVEVDLDL